MPEPVKTFDPFFSLKQFNGQPDTSGINWSYVKFSSAAKRSAFIATCHANGYRTRTEYEQAGYFLVQVHHYAD